MTTLTISSKGHIIILPVDIRRRLGLVAGTQIEVIEEPNGLRLVARSAVESASVLACAGMVTAPAKGKPRRLEDFDAAPVAAKA